MSTTQLESKENQQQTFSTIAENGSAYLPVETILHVSDDELVIEENKKHDVQTTVSSGYTSMDHEQSWKVDSSDHSQIATVSERVDEVIITSDPYSNKERNEEMSLAYRGWTPHPMSQPPDVQGTFPHTLSCNYEPYPTEENYLLSINHKERNKIKSKQRRSDPCYRSEERIRQRTVMRMKRQDPHFRDAEREKGRCRMRLKRLDPVFRTQERERQRERMKMKRSDPDFREKEREQQKTRLHIKRLDPAFKERERAQDRFRMRLKRQGNGSYTAINSERIKSSPQSEDDNIDESQTLKFLSESCASPGGISSTQAVFPENFSTRFFSIKHADSTADAFNFKKQHILNFNFYNSTREQWAIHTNMDSVSAKHFNIIDNDLKHSLQKHINNSESDKKDTIPSKDIQKVDDVSQNWANVKQERLHVDNEELINNVGVTQFSLHSCKTE